MTVMTMAMGLGASPSLAAPIYSNDIHQIPDSTSGSGNGTLDLRIMTFSGSEIDNDSGGFDGDNANNKLPQGGGRDTNTFAESYLTTAGEIQSYYTMNFGATTTGEVEIALFLDLNETGATAQMINWLEKLDIVLNPATINNDPDPLQDLTSAAQAAIDQIYTGGTLATYLAGSNPINLNVSQQGAGFADYALMTGIDPFALAPTDVLLFNVSMSALNNGAEEIFLSGTYTGGDVQAAVFANAPEPGTGLLVMMGLVWISRHARGRRRGNG